MRRIREEIQKDRLSELKKEFLKGGRDE